MSADADIVRCVLGYGADTSAVWADRYHSGPAGENRADLSFIRSRIHQALRIASRSGLRRFERRSHRIVARGNVVVSVSARDFDITSEQCERSGALVHLSGHVTVRIAAALLEAEIADLNEDTHKIVFDGDLHVPLN